MTEPIKITSVSYSRLVSLPDYENEKISASARVEDGQDPNAVLDELKEWTASKISSARDLNAEKNRLYELQSDIRNHEANLAAAKRKWEAASKLLEAHGINPEPWEDLPF